MVKAVSKAYVIEMLLTTSCKIINNSNLVGFGLGGRLGTQSAVVGRAVIVSERFDQHHQFAVIHPHFFMTSPLP